METSNKIGLLEFKKRVKNFKTISAHKKPKLKEVAWVALRILIDSNMELVFNDSLKEEFFNTFESLMKLDNIQLNRVVTNWLNKSYIYKKEEL